MFFKNRFANHLGGHLLFDGQFVAVSKFPIVIHGRINRQTVLTAKIVVIKTVTGEDVSMEQLGGAMSHATKSGVAHFVAENEEDCLAQVRYLMSFIPSNNLEDPPRYTPTDAPDRHDDSIAALIPESSREAYDMKDVVRRVVAKLNRAKRSVNGSQILLLGLAYKKNTGDARESPAVVVAERLIGMGAHVRAADPHVVEGHVSTSVVRVDASKDEVAEADLVVVLADHDIFDFAMIERLGRSVLDTRHRLKGPNVESV